MTPRQVAEKIATLTNDVSMAPQELTEVHDISRSLFNSSMTDTQRNALAQRLLAVTLQILGRNTGK